MIKYKLIFGRDVHGKHHRRLLQRQYALRHRHRAAFGAGSLFGAGRSLCSQRRQAGEPAAAPRPALRPPAGKGRPDPGPVPGGLLPRAPLLYRRGPGGNLLSRLPGGGGRPAGPLFRPGSRPRASRRVHQAGLSGGAAGPHRGRGGGRSHPLPVRAGGKGRRGSAGGQRGQPGKGHPGADHVPAGPLLRRMRLHRRGSGPL